MVTSLDMRTINSAAALQRPTTPSVGRTGAVTTTPVRDAEMARLQQNDFPEYVRRLTPILAVEDRANPFAYSLGSDIPIDIKRQVWADYQAGRGSPRTEITDLAGSNATYSERDGANGTIRINSALLPGQGEETGAGHGQMEAFAVWGHMEEVGHWADARAQQMMGRPGGDSLGDEGARYALLATGQVRDSANPATFIARYDISLSNGTMRTVDVDTTVLRAIGAQKIANGSFARENRVNGIENFGPEGHYQTTYITTVGAGRGLGINARETDQIANRIALGSQLPDMLENFDAYSQATHKAADVAKDVGTQALLGPILGRLAPQQWTPAEQRHLENVYEGLHALPRNENSTIAWRNNERAETRTFISQQIASGNFVRAGIAIHRYGDLHAHVRPNGTPYSGDLGHGLAGHTPDYLYTEDSQGRAASWSKATEYQASLSSVITEGLAARERGRGRTITAGTQRNAAETARSDWRTVYDGALTQSRSYPRGVTRTGTILSGADAGQATEIQFRNSAQTFINSYHNRAGGTYNPLTIGQMGVDGGYVPTQSMVDDMNRVMDQFDAPR